MYFDQVYCSELKLSDQSEAKCKTAFVLVPTTNYITINYTFFFLKTCNNTVLLWYKPEHKYNHQPCFNLLTI